MASLVVVRWSIPSAMPVFLKRHLNYQNADEGEPKPEQEQSVQVREYVQGVNDRICVVGPSHLNDTFLDVALDSWMKQKGLTKSWLFFDEYHEDRGLVATRCVAHGHHDTCHSVLPECCNHASCKPRCLHSLLALSIPSQSPCTFQTKPRSLFAFSKIFEVTFITKFLTLCPAP